MKNFTLLQLPNKDIPKVNNGNTKTSEICSMLTIKTQDVVDIDTLSLLLTVIKFHTFS